MTGGTPLKWSTQMDKKNLKFYQYSTLSRFVLIMRFSKIQRYYRGQGHIFPYLHTLPPPLWWSHFSFATPILITSVHLLMGLVKINYFEARQIWKNFLANETTKKIKLGQHFEEAHQKTNLKWSIEQVWHEWRRLREWKCCLYSVPTVTKKLMNWIPPVFGTLLQNKTCVWFWQCKPWSQFSLNPSSYTFFSTNEKLNLLLSKSRTSSSRSSSMIGIYWIFWSFLAEQQVLIFSWKHTKLQIPRFYCQRMVPWPQQLPVKISP